MKTTKQDPSSLFPSLGYNFSYPTPSKKITFFKDRQGEHLNVGDQHEVSPIRRPPTASPMKSPTSIENNAFSRLERTGVAGEVDGESDDFLGLSSTARRELFGAFVEGFQVPGLSKLMDQ